MSQDTLFLTVDIIDRFLAVSAQNFLISFKTEKELADRRLSRWYERIAVLVRFT